MYLSLFNFENKHTMFDLVERVLWSKAFLYFIFELAPSVSSYFSHIAITSTNKTDFYYVSYNVYYIFSVWIMFC